jgi:5-methyltetrahydropteroyltriglutamate--homocysteine methyltransferase
MTGSNIRTTHVGSLPRGSELTGMLLARESGKPVDEEALQRDVDAAVRQVIEAQIAAGVDIINDGEQSRPGFSTYITDRMKGFGGASKRRSASDFAKYPGFAKYWAWVFRGIPMHANTAPQAVGPIEYHGEAQARSECERLLRHLRGKKGLQGFMTAPSPGIISTTMQNAYYDSHERYVFALARELRKEYEVIANSGLLLQIDAPDLAMERNVEFQDNSDQEFLDVVEMHIAALNEALVNIPRERIRLHCCWGASERPHCDDIELGAILPILRKARVAALSIPFSNPRHQHEYGVLRKMPLPPDMKLIPGVIDNTTNFIEHPQVVANRILEAVSAMGGDPDRVIAGTDCGFATFAGFERVAEDVAFAKLRSCREGADLASAQLGKLSAR